MPRYLLIAVGALASFVVAGLLTLNSCAGTNGPDAGAGTTVRAAHGPTGIRDGVPTGYAHDREGAATAAVNIVQALTQAGQGRIRMDAVAATLLTRTPGPQLRNSMQIGSGRATGPVVVNLVPAAVSIGEYAGTSARVSVWAMTVSRGAIADSDRISLITAWSTQTLDLVWEDNDWKANEVSGRAGPTPEKSVTTPKTSAPFQSGYFSFYIN
ncbi:hypothetical protein D5S18_34205 [Nocardia panacis]|uniref:DUF8175 domain-containing protein n=1 Tax=Nocardia panacis TaxID=2340916 RepID=A0A3A4K744_9NOCA|nr:hypothetical protein D5S18_34205 [Nocardia panacis]